MGFFAPWFLAGLALVGLPIWLHLLRQHKSTPLPFSSLMFFERRTQSSIKHRRLRYLLLFALRTALLVALALAFAGPFVMSSSGLAGSGRKLLVVAIDNSFSMRQGTRLERAKQEAARLLSGSAPEDRGQVLAFASQARLLNEPTNDSAALQAAVQAIQPSDARSSFAELARTARILAQSARMPVDLHVFSDMQKSSLPPNFLDLRLGDGVKLIPHPIAEKRLPNFAVESVNAPRRVYDPKKVRIQATIVGLGTERVSRRVSLVLNTHEVASKQVEIPAGGRATAEFLSLEAPHGFNRGEIHLDSGDAFPDDDHFHFPVERTDPRSVLFVHEGRNGRDMLYFRTALEASAGGAFTLHVVSAEQCANLSPGKYAFVVLSDVASLPLGFEDTLRKYVRGGGSVFIALGPMSVLHNRVPVGDEVVRNVNYASREGERFQTVVYLDPAHPSIRRANRWEGVKFYQAIRVEPGKSRVIARLSDQTPLLFEKKIGEGRVLVFASTFDNISNDFPLHASFVPFIEQTAQYLGQLDRQPALFTIGSYLELRSIREQGAAVEVLDPRGRRALSLSESTRVQNIQLEREGFYEVRRPSGHHELVAVNPDRRESDLDLIPAETLALWQNTGQGSRTRSGTAETGQKPQSYWWYVMILALAFAVAESFLGNRHLSVDKETA